MTVAALDLEPRREPLGEAGVFYGLTVAMAAAAFLAFAPTYWLQLPGRTFRGPPLLHAHAILFSAWMVLVVWQARLAARAEHRRHRAFGLAGAALAGAMVVVGLATSIARVDEASRAGWGQAAREFMLVQVSGLALFAGLVTAAIVLARRPDWHRRLMIAATASLLQAAIGRIPFLVLHGVGPDVRPSHFAPPPVGLIVGPEMAVNLFLVIGLVVDVKRRGRPHPAWPVGLAAIATVTLLRAPLSHTDAWLGCADWLTRLTG